MIEYKITAPVPEEVVIPKVMLIFLCQNLASGEIVKLELILRGIIYPQPPMNEPVQLQGHLHAKAYQRFTAELFFSGQADGGFGTVEVEDPITDPRIIPGVSK